MKRATLVAVAVLFAALAFSQQTQEPKDLQETAKTFLREGDFKNAILVLNRAISQDGNNFELKKDLAYAYFLQRDYVKALEVAKPFADNPEADVQAFQILGMVYNAVEETKDAEKMYRAAIKKYPSSGVLYNNYGELLWKKRNFAEAAKQWEKGIEVDPNYSGNYYNAAKYHYFTADKVWGLIYGEMFVNLESYSTRTPEIKTLLLDGYKKLFQDADLAKNQNLKNGFVKAYLDNMKNQAATVSGGVTPESLSAVRTRFILDWFQKDAPRLPLRLFEYQQQLLKEGMFEAYNQWIFGAAKDLTAYQNWTTTHAEEYNKFDKFQKNRVFKVPANQYYASSK